MQVLTSISGIPLSAASAGLAPTNSAEVSAIASAYQVVSSTATQLHAGSSYVTSVNDVPLSASRAGQAANASMATSAYYDGTGRLISSLPDSAAVSAIASSYAEGAASGKQDALEFGYDDGKISSIDGSALAGGGGGLITSIESSIDPWYRTAISGLNGSALYPKWAGSAISAQYAYYAESAKTANSAKAAPTGWASSFISSVSSPSGTIRVLNGNEIEGTNSAVLPSTVVEGFSVVSSVQNTTAFSFTVPISNPNTQVIFTGDWANGKFGISGDNGITAESSLSGPLNVTFDMPCATAFDVTSEAWISVINYTASALASEVGGGVAELAWASALPTYTYDTADNITGIDGSSIGGAGGVDSGTVSAIASAYVESGVSGKLDSTASSMFYTTANESGFVDSAYVDSRVSGKLDSTAASGFYTTANESGFVDSAYVDSQVSGKMDSSASSSFYTTANESGFVDSAYVDSAVSGKMDASAIDYTRTGGGTQIYASGNGSSTNQFSANNDSAGAAIIVGENARLRLWDTAATANLYASSIGGWNAASNLVSSQSANWGGAALQLSAGAGISLTMSGSILIIATASA